MFKKTGKIILAIFLAIVLWVVANMEQDKEKIVTAQVVYSHLPENMIFMNKPPEEIRLRVQGSISRLSTLNPKNLVISLDLSSVSPGIAKFEILANQIKTPRGVQVVSITPAEIKLSIDLLVEKDVNVLPLVGSPDSGFEVVNRPIVVPSKVKVKGPNKILFGLELISTDLVSISGEKGKISLDVLLNPPPFVELVDIDTVRVTVDIQERVSVKEFKDVNIEFVNFKNINYKTDNSLKSDLIFEGPYNLIKDLNSDEIKVFVDGAEIKNKKKYKHHNLHVTVKYPNQDKISLKKNTPKQIKVTIN